MLGDRAIIASSESLQLSPALVWCDVVEFHRALAEEQWSDALALYRGDFLDGFFVRNASDFDQWALAERARLRTLATRGAAALTVALHRADRVPEAVSAAERALELAPYDEGLFRALVRLLIVAENPARAEAVAQGFIERLAIDLAISPSGETMQLVRKTRPRLTESIVVIAGNRVRRKHRRGTDAVTRRIIAQGRHLWHQRTRSSIERAIEYFTRAVARDPRAVDAWCGLAHSWIVMGGRGYAPCAEAIERGTASAERAMALDDTMPSAHTSIGGLNILRRRWHDAESALRRAIHLDPLTAEAHHWLSLTLLSGFGSREEAIREETIAASLNPLAPTWMGSLGWQRYLRAEYDLSRANVEPAVDLNADFEEGIAGLTRAAARLGDEATVRTTIAAGLARRHDLRGDLLAEQASALAVLGGTRHARLLMREASDAGAMPLNLALAWASMGEARRALEDLARESFLVYWAPQALWWDPRLDLLRDDKRFLRVLERVEQVWSPEWS
jgi:tetratricopeptide (TPR) repeat protein